MNYKIFNNDEELINNSCSIIIEEINSLSKEKIFVALSGGNTPKPLLQKLSLLKDQVNWERIILFQVDERCVPPEDNESNYKMIKESLLDNISLPEDNFKRMRGEEDPFNECIMYGKKILEGKIKFDIILLGMGADGHTASIFPRQFFLFKYEDTTAVSVFPGKDQKRITLTEQVINDASFKIFLVTGKDKAVIINKIFQKKDEDLPAGRIKGNVLWLLDSDAASEIKAGTEPE